MKRATIMEEITNSGRCDSGDGRRTEKGELVTTKMVTSDLEEPRTNDRDKQAKTVRRESGHLLRRDVRGTS